MSSFDILPIALTCGEPAGIGPDLCLLLARSAQPYPLVAIASRELLAARSIADLVEWSGGLYNPPARFRSW